MSAMGAVSNSIEMIAAASGVSPYASLHLPTAALSRATPQDVAVLSVEAIQPGETDSLFGHSLANAPFATLAALNGGLANTNPLPSAALADAKAMATAAPSESETPQQSLAGRRLQAVRALYSGQEQPRPTFSVMA